MTSVDTTAEIPLLHRLTHAQLVTALATMTAYTADHAVYELDALPAEVLVASLTRHLSRFGTEGKPTFPCGKHYDWAKAAAKKVLPLLQSGEADDRLVQVSVIGFESDGSPLRTGKPPA